MMSPLLGKAISIADHAHKGQTRWNGDPYIDHPIQVASFIPDEDGKIVAMLHDVVEDTEFTLQDLEDDGFPAHIINAVKAITHWPNHSYEDYLKLVINDPIARRVKIADVTYNLISLMTDYSHKKDKIVKYKKALDYLI